MVVQRSQNGNDRADDISCESGTAWQLYRDADRFKKLSLLHKTCRILCELIGGWVENGEYPADMKVLGKMVEDISYNNAVRYFGFDLETK